MNESWATMQAPKKRRNEREWLIQHHASEPLQHKD